MPGLEAMGSLPALKGKAGKTNRNFVASGAGRQMMAETWTVSRMNTVRPTMRWLSSNLVECTLPIATAVAAPAVPAR